MASKTTGNTKRVETWTLGRGTKSETQVVKIAVRNTLGQFHGATNFRQAK